VIILRWQEGGTAILEADGRSYEEIAAGREAAAAWGGFSRLSYVL
jgi:hypothetical protein